MAKNTGLGSRAAAGASGRFPAMKARGGAFGQAEPIWRRSAKALRTPAGRFLHWLSDRLHLAAHRTYGNRRMHGSDGGEQ